jgi:hypothetical protein
MPKFTIKVPLIVALAIVTWYVTINPAKAGGGPENVFLVVNPNSPDSLTIANHFIELRRIPAGNVFYLPWNPQSEYTTINSFRSRILKPIIEAIRSRRLSGQIDYVVYSCDFPLRINYQDDLKKFDSTLFSADSATSSAKDKPIIIPPQGKMDPIRSNPVASLNGLTYLWRWALTGEPDYLNLQSNQYTRLPIAAQEDKPTLGFRSAWQFGPQGELVETDGKSYLLSVLLGVTYGRGNTVEEILHYLKRSAAADGTRPSGTIYFVKNSDVRSRARDGLFPTVAEELKKLGVDAQIIKGIVPIDKKDVQGVVMGTEFFNWEKSGSTILPGAICENFTSYGGLMVPGVKQTSLSEFLRYGAAGSSGTVVEPFAILQKFPLPMIQVHYARGCTLAEAFYQSIFAPYQIMIVGDPLCRPWANIPQVKVSGVKPDYIVKGTLTLTPAATTPSGRGIDHFELFVNGSRATQCKPGGKLTLDTALLPDGYQELRVVAVEAGLIQSQGRIILPIITENHGRTIEAKLVSEGTIRPDNPALIDVDSPGSVGISVLQNSRIVGRIAGEKGQIKIAAAELGSGPVRLQVIGLGKGGPRTHVLAPPINLTVEVPEKKESS